MSIVIKSVDENYNDIYKSFTPKMDEEINLYKTAYASQRDSVKNNYNSLITDSNESYYDEQNRNAIQKIVNEKKIAENMENLGLTDSGLNRTQQTAVQLSYSNSQAKSERQRQKAVDALNLEMAGKLTEIDTDESNTVASIKDKYHQAALSAAQEKYNTEVEALTDITTAQIEAASKSGSGGSGKSSNNNSGLLFKFTGTQVKDGKDVNTYRGSDGKTYYADVGLNPYTSDNNIAYGNGNKFWGDVKDNNKLSDSQKAAAVYGTTSNGYQPKGVVYDGVNYGSVNIGGSIPEGNEITGKKQNVWKTQNTATGVHYWIWYGKGNTYAEVVLQNGAWVVKE